ncbi:MAG: hypothetical protein QGH15_00815 [Kiritimatiellia bacterium]|jgi:hypothetical protein|nr:hypothetical protein [Kiritimatiellia bacterium]
MPIVGTATCGAPAGYYVDSLGPIDVLRGLTVQPAEAFGRGGPFLDTVDPTANRGFRAIDVTWACLR